MSTRRLALVLSALTIAGFGSLMGLRDSLSWVAGDEGTYMAMAESLALDGDLVFSAADRARAESLTGAAASDLILQRTSRGITYSKPILYPLLASPLVRLAGGFGLVLFNALALGGALWLTVLYLRRLGRSHLYLTLVTFVGTSALLPYLVWRMSDALLVSCTLAGLVLALAAVRKSADRSLHGSPFLDSRLAPLAGGLLLGLAAVMRYPNALLGVGALVALLCLKKWIRAAALLLGIALAVLPAVSLSVWLTGASDPYRAPRSTFNQAVGFPDGPDAEVARQQLDSTALATVRLRTEIRPRVLAYSSLYYFVGRHSGLAIYFPAALVLALLALRKPDPVALAMLGSVVGIALFHLLLLPHNYFGGGAAIGNRYFLASYPALLIAQRRLPGPRWMLAPWLIAVAALASAIVSISLTREGERNSQVHSYAGIFRMLPYESTLQSIDGSTERFWLHDWEYELVRFNDPFARVGPYSFTLESGRPPAELEVANTREDGLMRFLVLSEAPKLLIDYTDWRQSRTFELERPLGDRGLIEVHASPAWRRHPFWFHWRLEDIFEARLLRLAIRTPDGSPASAELRYLGPVEIPRDIYSREVIGSELPTLAGAGTTSIATVTVRNTSSETWKSDRVLAVYLSYRLFHRTEQGVQTFEGPRTPLAEAIPPGGVLSAEVEVRWPAMPRNYGLAVDLVQEGIAWFEQPNGAPLARSEVRVISLPKAEPLPPTGEQEPADE